MAKPIKITRDSSYKDLVEVYNQTKNNFVEFYRLLDLKRHVLARGKAYDELEPKTLKNLDSIEDDIEAADTLIGRVNEKEWTPNDSLKLYNSISAIVAGHESLGEDSLKIEKSLPIAQTIKLYLIKAFDLLSKLCAAVVNFLTKTLPNKASEAKSSFAASLGKLGESVKKLGTEAPKKSGPGASV